eukprot:CAMPEP_0117580810 /NCGR_PEP_ID=MMETSP0784-20121206/65433_1 /TAXON_ID=39447 /ORGANISM="" /LENGTH=131 /DNA_ID=CAMNT_0005380961 /DNA_START=1 /DNA_END=392 /DNA_ORIENTATION=-
MAKTSMLILASVAVFAAYIIQGRGIYRRGMPASEQYLGEQSERVDDPRPTPECLSYTVHTCRIVRKCPANLECKYGQCTCAEGVCADSRGECRPIKERNTVIKRDIPFSANDISGQSILRQCVSDWHATLR